MNDYEKKTIEFTVWQIKALRRYFGENDKTQVSHWAFPVFDKALPKKSHPREKK